MLYKTIGKRELAKLVDIHLRDIERVGPVEVGTDSSGKPIHQYLPFDVFDETDLEYETTEYSAKSYFLPFRETLSRFRFADDDWEQEIQYRKHPRVVVGLHPCDINGLVKLDKVFARDQHPNPYYLSRRGNTFIIGIDCQKPCHGGFCSSVGADTVTHGFDLFLTDIGERYFVKVGSDRAFIALGQLDARDITEEDRELYLKKRNRFESYFERDVRVENLPNLLDIEFESKVWDKWGDKCLSCGSCAMACPTCYCYGVEETLSMDFKTGEKVKQLYSCNLYDFAQVAGGHNFRPDRHIRLKYRYYHQHRGFVDKFGQPMCVGCNRCGRTCLAGIEPAYVIRDLQMEQLR